MASTYSDLKIELIGTGEQVGTWGATTNANLGTAIEEAIVGSADVAFSSTDVTLTLTNTNGTQAARHLRLNLTGTSGGARNLILGSGCQIDKPYIINNGLADTVTVKNTTGTGIAVPAGKSMWVFNNGTNVVEAMNHAASLTLGAALPVASGGTGATTLTGILRGNGTSAFTAGGVNLASEVTGTLPIANGGTGATTDTNARTNLGLGTIATQNSNSVTITGGTITGITDLAVADGGTGASSFTAGTYLKGNGTSAITGQSGIPGADITSGDIAAARITNALNATGSPPIFASRAWVNFNGSNGTVLASGNVTSVTDTGVGKFTINFTTAMPDINYVFAGSGQIDASGNTDGNHLQIAPSRASDAIATTAIKVSTTTVTGNVFDGSWVGASVIR